MWRVPLRLAHLRRWTDFQSRDLIGRPLTSSSEPLFPKRGPPACVGASPRALGRHLVAERGDALAPSPHSRRPPGSRTPSSPTPADPAFADPQTCAPLALRSHSWHGPAGARGAAAGAELRAGRPPPPRGSQSRSGIERKQTIVVTRARGRVTRTNAQPRRERRGLRTGPL